jgi:hypothetical protein
VIVGLAYRPRANALWPGIGQGEDSPRNGGLLATSLPIAVVPRSQTGGSGQLRFLEITRRSSLESRQLRIKRSAVATGPRHPPIRLTDLELVVNGRSGPECFT